jgi:hypothetical protein
VLARLVICMDASSRSLFRDRGSRSLAHGSRGSRCHAARNPLARDQGHRERQRVADHRGARLRIRRPLDVCNLDPLSCVTAAGGQGPAATVGSLSDLSLDCRYVHTVDHRCHRRCPGLVDAWHCLGTGHPRRDYQVVRQHVAHPASVHGSISFDWLDRRRGISKALAQPNASAVRLDGGRRPVLHRRRALLFMEAPPLRACRLASIRAGRRRLSFRRDCELDQSRPIQRRTLATLYCEQPMPIRRGAHPATTRWVWIPTMHKTARTRSRRPATGKTTAGRCDRRVHLERQTLRRRLSP